MRLRRGIPSECGARAAGTVDAVPGRVAGMQARALTVVLWAATTLAGCVPVQGRVGVANAAPPSTSVPPAAATAHASRGSEGPASGLRATPTLSVEASATPTVHPEPAMAPTWSQLYDRYFSATSDGGCARKGKCHADPMRDAPSAYAWLRQRGYIDGPGSALVSTTNSCLRAFGGNMPPSGQLAPEAGADIRAWALAGATAN